MICLPSSVYPTFPKPKHINRQQQRSRPPRILYPLSPTRRWLCATIMRLHNRSDNASWTRRAAVVRSLQSVPREAHERERTRSQPCALSPRSWVCIIHAERGSPTQPRDNGVKSLPAHVYAREIPGNLQVYELFHNGCKV